MTHKTPAEWSKVKAEAVTAGSIAQATSVLQMALDDIAALSRELAEARTRAECAEAGIPGLVFSKRKALVERCAKIVEEYARKAGQDRAYMLKGPALWLRDIATAVRERSMGPGTDG